MNIISSRRAGEGGGGDATPGVKLYPCFVHIFTGLSHFKLKDAIVVKVISGGTHCHLHPGGREEKKKTAKKVISGIGSFRSHSARRLLRFHLLVTTVTMRRDGEEENIDWQGCKSGCMSVCLPRNKCKLFIFTTVTPLSLSLPRLLIIHFSLPPCVCTQ